LRSYGGIEAWYIKHSENVVKKFSDIAKKFNLLVTGVSGVMGHTRKKNQLWER
jgi:predicted metal-dependent phosphoesterase TrpH